MMKSIPLLVDVIKADAWFLKAIIRLSVQYNKINKPRIKKMFETCDLCECTVVDYLLHMLLGPPIPLCINFKLNILPHHRT